MKGDSHLAAAAAARTYRKPVRFIAGPSIVGTKLSISAAEI
jgi:hypothetical protein